MVGGLSKRSTLILDEPGYYLIIKGQEGGELVHEVSTDRAKTSLQVTPGPYFIQRRESRYYLEYQIELEPKGSRHLKLRDGKRVDYARLVRKGSHDTPALHGLSAGVAYRNNASEGLPAGEHLLLEYAVDLPQLTLQTRLRYHATDFTSVDGILSGELDEWGLGLGVHRFWDLPALSLGIGVVSDVAQVRQRFTTQGNAAPRRSVALGVAALGTVQAALWEALTIELELGPWIHFQKSGFTYAGALSEETLTTTTLFWVGVKMGLKL